MVWVQIVLILVLVLINGLLSGSELAVVSSRRARLQRLADGGDAGAKATIALNEHPDRFLSTAQIGITLVGILSGAFGGATLSGPLANLLDGIPLIGSWADSIAVLLVVLTITYLSLVFGELVPKRIALLYPERVAVMVARPLTTLSRISRPVVSLLTSSSNAIMRLLRIGSGGGEAVTEEEIEHLIAEGTRAGVFEQAEQVLVGGVFDLSDRNVDDLMTPRHRVISIDRNAPIAEQRQQMSESPHSVFPFIDVQEDQPVGVLFVKTLWSHETEHGPVSNLTPFIQPALYIPETASAFAALEHFRAAGTGFAIVLNEFGLMEGILTLHDLFEAIAGEFPEPADTQAMVLRDDGSWLVDGDLPIHELREKLKLPAFPGEESGEFTTLGGFIMAELQRIPRPADRIVAGKSSFEVVDMDGTRVDKVLITRINHS
jgi:putative hemolysin